MEDAEEAKTTISVEGFPDKTKATKPRENSRHHAGKGSSIPHLTVAVVNMVGDTTSCTECHLGYVASVMVTALGECCNISREPVNEARVLSPDGFLVAARKITGRGCIVESLDVGSMKSMLPIAANIGDSQTVVTWFIAHPGVPEPAEPMLQLLGVASRVPLQLFVIEPRRTVPLHHLEVASQAAIIKLPGAFIPHTKVTIALSVRSVKRQDFYFRNWLPRCHEAELPLLAQLAKCKPLLFTPGAMDML